MVSLHFLNIGPLLIGTSVPDHEAGTVCEWYSSGRLKVSTCLPIAISSAKLERLQNGFIDIKNRTHFSEAIPFC